MTRPDEIRPQGVGVVVDRSGRHAPLWERLRHTDARLTGQPALAQSVGVLGNARYLLLESERADGTQVATPVCFAVLEGAIVLRTGAESAKVRRIRARPVVRAGACTLRGKPLDSYIECIARFVAPEKQPQAEAALRHRHGLRRRLITWLVHPEWVYLELTPITTADRSPRDGEVIAAGIRAGTHPTKATPGRTARP